MAAHPRTSDFELRLVYGSIDLVASGAATRATHVGMRHGRLILPQVQASGDASGVVVRARWRETPDDCDITVEAFG
jgi:hypothetical protein